MKEKNENENVENLEKVETNNEIQQIISNSIKNEIKNEIKNLMAQNIKQEISSIFKEIFHAKDKNNVENSGKVENLENNDIIDLEKEIKNFKGEN